jgi:hypothetical protein
MRVLGSHMGKKLQDDCLRQFVHRFTKQHVPAWANKEWKDGITYPVQFASDAEWLSYTFFEVTVKGELSKRVHYCESSPTWPDNPELRKETVK